MAHHIRKEHDTGAFRKFLAPSGDLSLPYTATTTWQGYAVPVDGAGKRDYTTATPLTVTVPDLTTGETMVTGFEAIDVPAGDDFAEFDLEIEGKDGALVETFPSADGYYRIRILKTLGDQ